MAKTDGAQVVGKVCDIMQLLAAYRGHGLRLLDISEKTGISRPTVHRILGALQEQNFVGQTQNRRYVLGPTVFELGLAAQNPIEKLDRLQPYLDRLAAKIGDTVYLAMQRNRYAVYLMRAEGAFPIRAYIISVGERIPMVSSLGGIAILSTYDQEAIEDYLEDIDPDDPHYRNATPEGVHDMINYIGKHGYAWAENVIMYGVAGMAAAVPRKEGYPYLAITLSAITSRLPPERVKEVGPLMVDAAAEIGALLDG